MESYVASFIINYTLVIPYPPACWYHPTLCNLSSVPLKTTKETSAILTIWSADAYIKDLED